jgi:ribose transport system substrate-binding protein
MASRNQGSRSGARPHGRRSGAGAAGWVACGLWAACAAAALGQGKTVHQAADGAALKLAFITNNASDFWNIARKGVQKAEREFGLQVTFLTPKDPPKAEDQNNMLRDLAAQGYHGLAISPIEPKAQWRDLDDVAEKLNVVTHDADAPRSKRRLAYIGTNNYEAGKLLGQAIKKKFPSPCRVAVFAGSFSADNAKERRRGLTEALGDGYDVVSKEDDTDRAKAKANVEDVLLGYSDVKALAGIWSYNTPQIVNAVKARDLVGKVAVFGFDEEKDTLDAIAAGVCECTVVQKPFEFGYQSVKLLRELALKGQAALPADPQIDTGVALIDKGNVAAFAEELKELRK